MIVQLCMWVSVQGKRVRDATDQSTTCELCFQLVDYDRSHVTLLLLWACYRVRTTCGRRCPSLAPSITPPLACKCPTSPSSPPLSRKTTPTQRPPRPPTLRSPRMQPATALTLPATCAAPTTSTSNCRVRELLVVAVVVAVVVLLQVVQRGAQAVVGLAVVVSEQGRPVRVLRVPLTQPLWTSLETPTSAHAHRYASVSLCIERWLCSPMYRGHLGILQGLGRFLLRAPNVSHHCGTGVVVCPRS